ncbi:hypothetical protein [Actinoplanes sp. NPDC023714]|uniref:hypothetical protein n=1 Tax=Actinoplanes sp. NPDC023714 TaxID=3154322 RepID=UPI0033C791A6
MWRRSDPGILAARLHAEIVAETSDQVDFDASLRRLVEQLRAAVAEGEASAPRGGWRGLEEGEAAG